MDSTVAVCPPGGHSSPPVLCQVSCMRPLSSLRHMRPQLLLLLLLLQCLQASQGGGHHSGQNVRDPFAKSTLKRGHQYSPGALIRLSEDEKARRIGNSSLIDILPTWLTGFFSFKSRKSAVSKRGAEFNGSRNIFQKLLPWLFHPPIFEEAFHRRVADRRSFSRSRPVDYQRIVEPITVRRSVPLHGEHNSRQREKKLDLEYKDSSWIPLHVHFSPEKEGCRHPLTAWSSKRKDVRQPGINSDDKLWFGSQREARVGWTPLAKSYQSEGNSENPISEQSRLGVDHITATTQRPFRRYHTSQPWRDLYRSK